MAQQREAARQQQASKRDVHRQQDLQQRVLASLSPQQLQQLRSMPRVWLTAVKTLLGQVMLEFLHGLGSCQNNIHGMVPITYLPAQCLLHLPTVSTGI